MDIKEEARRELVTNEDRVEIIMLVVDNDRDVAIKAIEGIFLADYPFKLTIYENSLNSRNTSKIWNKLIRESTCGYVMLIDSDAFPQNKGWLRELVSVLERRHDCAAVGPVAGEDSVSNAQKQPYDAERTEDKIDGHLSGYCMLFRRSVFDKIGYFDEDFVFYGQESDWIEKTLERGNLRPYICYKSHVKHGIDGMPSTSSMRMEKDGIFDRRLDSEYARALWHLKKEERKKNNENLDSRG